MSTAPTAVLQKRKADTSGLQQDARYFATPASAPRIFLCASRSKPAPRQEPVPRREPAPRCEPVKRCEPVPSPQPELCSDLAPAGFVITAQLLPPAPGPRKRPFDASCLPEAVRQLSTTGRLLEELAAGAFLEMDVPRRNAMARAVLDNAKAMTARQLQPGLAVFKIGITINPTHRWHNKVYGYGHSPDKYINMVILLMSASGEAAAFWEAALIEQFRETAGCRTLPPEARGCDRPRVLPG